MKKTKNSQTRNQNSSQTTFQFEEPSSVSNTAISTEQKQTPVSSTAISTDAVQDKSLAPVALHYGEATFLGKIFCDVYILSDGRAVMSERGFADLLGMDQKSLNSMRGDWPQKTLEPFWDKGVSMATTLAKVEADNCPYKGREIVVYDSASMEAIIRTYAMAFANDALRENQKHIGLQASMLIHVLVKTSLHVIIESACGLIPKVQKILERYHKDTIFARVNDLLFYFLRIPYPDRDREVYGHLISTCFRYIYEDVLGKETYEIIKSRRKLFHPIHQYIADESLRNRCFCYGVLLACYMGHFAARTAVARKPVQEMLAAMIENNSPGLVDLGKSSGQKTFDFVKSMPLSISEDGKLLEAAEVHAVRYTEITLPGQKRCDAYILEDGTVGMSERGLADFLGIDHMALLKMAKNGLPKRLQGFVEPGESLAMFSVRVTASDSPYLGRTIHFYPVVSIYFLLRLYAQALCAQALQKNQQHIGKRALILQIILTRTALDAIIREACRMHDQEQNKQDSASQKTTSSRGRKPKTGVANIAQPSLYQERQILVAALKLCYPQSGEKALTMLSAKAFQMAYKQVLTPEEYQETQEKAQKSKTAGENLQPLYEFIPNPQTKAMYGYYILLVAFFLACDRTPLARAVNNASRLFSTLSRIYQKILEQRL